jgi:Domain of unknown function (DUF4160)
MVTDALVRDSTDLARKHPCRSFPMFRLWFQHQAVALDQPSGDSVRSGTQPSRPFLARHHIQPLSESSPMTSSSSPSRVGSSVVSYAALTTAVEPARSRCRSGTQPEPRPVITNTNAGHSSSCCRTSTRSPTSSQIGGRSGISCAHRATARLTQHRMPSAGRRIPKPSSRKRRLGSRAARVLLLPLPAPRRLLSRAGARYGSHCCCGRKRGVRLTSGQTAPFIRTRRSRDNRCQAMSGMPPAGAAAWVACLPSVGSSGSRSRCFRRPRAASFARSPCAGQRQVRIDSLEVIDSSLPRRQLRFVLAWAELHQAELHENWRRARAGETLQPIEPLR